MTKTITTTIAIMMVLGVSAPAGARAPQSVVAPNGNDTNPATLAKNIATPPDSARIWVYWFWLNGNITRGGITADLEAMKRAGVGGVLIMEVDQGSPVGPVAFMSERWRELFNYMVAEAHRLGIEVANLWANRMIGDGKLPPEKRICRSSLPPLGGQLLESGLLGPMRLLTARQITLGKQ